MNNVIRIDREKLIEEKENKSNRYHIVSNTICAVCFYSDIRKGYCLIVYDKMDRNIFTNFSNKDRALNFDSVRVILQCYEFKITHKDYERIERESSKKQNSLRFELVVPNIDDTDYVC